MYNKFEVQAMAAICREHPLLTLFKCEPTLQAFKTFLNVMYIGNFPTLGPVVGKSFQFVQIYVKKVLGTKSITQMNSI